MDEKMLMRTCVCFVFRFVVNAIIFLAPISAFDQTLAEVCGLSFFSLSFFPFGQTNKLT